MKFLSVYLNKERNTPPSPAEMERMGKLVEEGFKSGRLVAVEGCMLSAFGARVRLDTGTVTVKDGPFSESKEVIGGLAIIKANSKAEAIEYVRDFLRIAGDGECELRQLYEAGGAMPCADQTAKAQA